MSRRTWRWVTRNPGDDSICIWPKLKKPTRLDPELTNWTNLDVAKDGYKFDGAYVCAFDFHRLTGIDVPTDRPIKVDFTGVRVLEE